MATSSEESLVSEGGAELVSPILKDSSNDWQTIVEICEHMKKFPGNKGDKVISDSKCGLHIHFDSECLTHNPQIMKNFLRLYAESEELLYKMCNDKDDPIRKNAINKDLKGLHLISSLWRNGMAAPMGKKILQQIENGTLNSEIIKQNVFLYASLINTAIQITEQPQLYQEQLNEFYRTDVNEEQKANNFLNLIMSEPNDRQIYIDRWQSVKGSKVFENNSKKGFAQNRFKREQFSRITERTPVPFIKRTYAQIKQMISRTNDKGDFRYDR